MCEIGPLFAQTLLPRPLLPFTRVHTTLVLDDKPGGKDLDPPNRAIVHCGPGTSIKSAASGPAEPGLWCLGPDSICLLPTRHTKPTWDPHGGETSSSDLLVWRALVPVFSQGFLGAYWFQ